MKIIFLAYPWKRSDPVLKPEQRLECFEWALKGLASEVNRTATEGAYYGPPITFAFQDLRSPDEIPIRLEIIKLLLTYGTNFFESLPTCEQLARYILMFR